jgi:hypothetical protein
MDFYSTNVSTVVVQKEKKEHLCSRRKISNRNGNLWLVTDGEKKSVASSNCSILKVYKAVRQHMMHIRSGPGSSCEIQIGQCFVKCSGLPRTFWPDRIQIPIRNNRPDPDLRPYPATFWQKNLHNLPNLHSTYQSPTCKVADPQHFNTDPDPELAFTLLWIRIQRFIFH